MDERCLSCPYRPRDCCQTAYPRRLIQTLLENGTLAETFDGTWEWKDVEGWIELRAIVEKTGDVESEALATVIDIERGLVALQSRHPEGALIVAATMMLDFTAADFVAVFGERHDSTWMRKYRRSIAFLAAWLSGLPIDAPKGEASCELMWKRAR